ncbi:4500_t:CDS:2 [Funneliformis caledonium]|uniref:4500_t:CDS:1 n=1 Tax=Funneliformis caledonium TaxID=1117310 RepID=A0A9N8WL86_9GLOM|nr:4500_t:CDS:2 [Funneliformis caledonium]
MSKISKDIDLQQELNNYQNLNCSLNEQLDRTHKENKLLSDENSFLRKKVTSFQQQISNNHNECVRLESELYQQGQELERLKKENVGFLKNKREVERKLREETQAFEKDRIVWQERESELLDQAKALQDTINVLAQQNEQVSEKKNGNTPTGHQPRGLCYLESITSEDVSHYTTIRELKGAQRTIKEIERRNNEITAELDKAKQATTESMNLSKSHVRRIQQLENELSQVKHMNQALMEENEGYQLLLHEKTMKGEFMLNPIMQRNGTYTEKKCTGTIEKVTNDSVSSPPIDDDNKVKNKNSIATDLAAELDRASLLTSFYHGERVHKESDTTIIDKLQDKIKSLTDANKCLRLYIEKILNRIIETQGFEEILSSESEWKKPSASSHENKTKKIERRKTVSVLHFRSTSQPQNSLSPINKIIAEEPDKIYPLPSERKSNEDTITLGDAPKRVQRRNSSSGTKNAKRFSIFNWVGGAKEEERKEDPFMRPMILVQEKERKE